MVEQKVKCAGFQWEEGTAQGRQGTKMRVNLSGYF
mgnify:CR=1 FL=1